MLDETRVAFSATPNGATAAVAAFLDCWILRFLPSPDAPLPPKYASDAEKEGSEWIIRPPARLCEDVCGGLTLRKMTAADFDHSPLARALEGCCTWSWAGFGGLKFEPGGKLVTPWGGGIWGAPNEAQGGRSPALLAEFAGQQHLLRASLRDGKVASLQSRRCHDNDASHVALVQGAPPPLAVS